MKGRKRDIGFSHRTLLPIWTGLLILMLLLDITLGGHGLGPDGLAEALRSPGSPYSTILFSLRLPRAVCAALSGMALSLAGTLMQAIFRNPLSDPHIMGVSGGAALGAALLTMVVPATSPLFTWGISLAGASFLGAGISSIIILLIARRFHSSGTILIAGVMLGFIFSAITSIIQYSSSEESLKLFFSWSGGSFQSGGWNGAALLLCAFIIGGIISLPNLKGLDAILFGEEFCSMVGGSPRKTITLALLSCCILAGTVTSVCGPLGFVGIVAPHLARKLGHSAVHRAVIPLGCILGGILGVCADFISHILQSPMPVGSTLALLGIPVIFFFLLSSHNDFNS